MQGWPRPLFAAQAADDLDRVSRRDPLHQGRRWSDALEQLMTALIHWGRMWGPDGK